VGEVWFNVKMEMPYYNRRNMNQVKEKTVIGEEEEREVARPPLQGPSKRLPTYGFRLYVEHTGPISR